MQSSPKKSDHLSYEQLAQHIPLEEFSNIPITENQDDVKAILNEVEEKSQHVHTKITIAVVHDHTTQRNVVIILIKEFGKNVVARIFSIFSYYFTWQRFINMNMVNLELSADYSNMIQIANVMRELLRFIMQDTKMAVDAHQVEKLKSIFLMLHLAAIPATLATLAINQTYAFLLPTIGRNNEISQQLRFIPSLFAFNYHLVMVLTAYNNYGNGRGHLNALLGIFCLGGVTIMGTYYGLSQLSTDLNYFILANVTQNVLITGSYLAYLRWQHGDESLMSELIKVKEWPHQFKHALKTVKLGLQPAFITLTDVSRGILTNLFMRNAVELQAFQILQFFPNVFAGMAGIEPRIAAQCIEAWNTHKKNPVVLKKELYQILLHSTWLASLPPVGFLFFCLLLRETALGIHRKPSSEFDAIYQLMERDLLLMSVTPLLRTLNYVLNGVITAFKKMKDPVAELTDENTEILDPYYQAINRQSVVVMGTASLAAFLIGLGLDYSNEAGAQNYWAATIGVMLVVLPIQLRNVVKSIQHTVLRAEDNVNSTVREAAPASQSYFTVFASTSRAAFTRLGESCQSFFTPRIFNQ